ncbi:MAG: TlpA disulfide reductase family protein [Candidatus Bathyarchaeia archaeon]
MRYTAGLRQGTLGKKSQSRILRKKTSAQNRKAVAISVVSFSFLALAVFFVYSSMNSPSESYVVLSNPPSGISQSQVGDSDRVKGDSVYPVAEDFTLTDIDGNRFTLSDFKGKIVILDFMGAQCKPCKQQVIELGKVHLSWSEKVEILSISVYGGKGISEELHAFANSYNVKWRIAVDVEGASFKYRITLIPSLIVIDPDGYVRYRHEGVADAATLIKEIKTILGEV